MSKEKRTVWITRWALTKGLFQVEGTVTDCGKYLSCPRAGFFVIGKDTAGDVESAKLDARIRKDARIKSLEKQIEKLKRLKFD